MMEFWLVAQQRIWKMSSNIIYEFVEDLTRNIQKNCFHVIKRLGGEIEREIDPVNIISRSLSEKSKKCHAIFDWPFHGSFLRVDIKYKEFYLTVVSTLSYPAQVKFSSLWKNVCSFGNTCEMNKILPNLILPNKGLYPLP